MRVIAAFMLLVTACEGPVTGFDTAAWKAGAGNHDGKNPRAELVAAALAAVVKVGARRADIRALLGDPDSTGTEADIWYLGRDAMSVDFRTLRVDYDAAGLATKVEDQAT